MAAYYLPLLYHSNYGYGGSSFTTLFKKLRAYKIPACGIVDPTFFGIAEFIKLAKDYRIKPIIGAEIIAPDIIPDNQALYFFARDKIGYKKLCQILTLQAFNQLNLDLLKKHIRSLILISNSIKILKNLQPFCDELYYLLLPYHSILSNEFPAIAANEIFYIEKNEKILYQLMGQIKKQSQPHKKLANHLLSPEEFKQFYASYPESIKNNIQIMEKCNLTIENRQWVLPKQQVMLDEILKARIKNLNRQQRIRFEYEYKLIKETGFESYFCLVHQLKEFARTQGIGINVRGSAASSFILYLLGLSIVNPLQYQLPFERFLNPEREEPPDIDLDVEYDKRDILIEQIFKRFAANNAAHIAVVNRFQTRAQFRNTARAFGVTPFELKNIGNYDTDYLINNIKRLSAKINNYPAYFSCHPSGIVITPQPLTNYIPLFPSTDNLIIQTDKHGTGLLGLVKIDILGVRGFPALLLNHNKINLNDQKVYNLIGAGKTLGCFQIESPAVRGFLTKIKPRTLQDIANAIAIIRPGPAQGGMKEKFLKRLQGKEEIKHLHPVLKEGLDPTLGIPIYQEQILQIAHDFAGFSLHQGDLLRRAITKQSNARSLQAVKNMFFEKAAEYGYTKKEINSVWHHIASFSAFSFNKAHALTYAGLAYLSAYQKLYYPKQFFCRLINNKGGYYSTIAYINEARRWGIIIKPPAINRSDYDFIIENNSLITGLKQIKNLSYGIIQRIKKLRPFKDPADFFYRVRPSMAEGRSLITSGTIDGFKVTWPKLYLLLLLSKLESREKYFKSNKNMFCNQLPDLKDFAPQFKAIEKINSINFLPEHHILEFFYPDRSTKISQITGHKKFTLVATIIAQRTILTRNKKLMSFLTLDDETGVTEAILFPDKYKLKPITQIIKIQGMVRDNSIIIAQLTNLSLPQYYDLNYSLPIRRFCPNKINSV